MKDVYKPPFDSLRQIHLDFHTPDFVKVGRKFDAKQFFDTLEEAHVNAVSVFATCHHGNSYFDTETGMRHPGLDFDLFGRMAEEASKRPVALLAYVSMNVNEVQAAHHPDWHALRPDGSSVNSQILQDGYELYWTWLCPNRSGLLEDFFYPHVDELLDRYAVDGLFIDMAGYLPESCFCEKCVSMMRAGGMDPRDIADHNRFNHETIQKIAAELRRRLDERRPGMRLQMAGFNAYGEAHKARGILSDFYIESLAYQTGWDYFPLAARYFRRFGLPVVGYTGRFLKSWGDFGTEVSAHQLKTQLSMHLAAGVASGIGDHMHFDGRLNRAVYAKIGEAFEFVKQRQPWCVGLTPAKEIGILVPEGVETNAATMDRENPFLTVTDSYKACAKLMTELHYQYEIIDAHTPLEGLAAVFINDGLFDAPFAQRVSRFVEEGGWAFVGAHALWPEDEKVRETWCALIGVRSFGFSDHEGEFYEATDPRVAGDPIPDMPHRVHLRAVDAEFADDVEPLARGWRSPNARSREKFYGHYFGPASAETTAAVAVRPVGKGGVILIRPQLLAAYLRTGYFVHRALVAKLLDAFLPEQRRVLRTNAPSLVELAFGRKDGRYILQALPFVADRRDRSSFESTNEAIAFSGIWVDIPPVGDVKRVHDPVAGRDLSWEKVEGRVRVQLPPFSEHLLVVIEPR